MKKKVVIIGSGPAGYTAAIYCARAGLEPLLFEGFFTGPGGQLMTTTEVENYPGFPEGVTGPELTEKFRKQAERFGTLFITEDVEQLDLSKRPFQIFSKRGLCEAEVVIIATGATAKRLAVPGTGEGEFWQKGVTACAVCDGAMPIFRNKDLFVIGGGDTAIEEALFLTRFGKKIYIVHRRAEFRASKIMAERALSHPKIEVLWDTVLEKVEGDEVVQSVTLRSLKDQSLQKKEGAGVFFAIGHEPNTKFLEGQLQLYPNGYIRVEPGSCRTSIEGVFAAGDVQDFHYRQAITAAGSGCMAALEAERWLSAQGTKGSS